VSCGKSKLRNPPPYPLPKGGGKIFLSGFGGFAAKTLTSVKKGNFDSGISYFDEQVSPALQEKQSCLCF